MQHAIAQHHCRHQVQLHFQQHAVIEDLLHAQHHGLLVPYFLFELYNLRVIGRQWSVLAARHDIFLQLLPDLPQSLIDLIEVAGDAEAFDVYAMQVKQRGAVHDRARDVLPVFVPLGRLWT